ncbi:MAG: hypothetical protein ABG776_17445, partial [Cyanobacteria bacterium J06555_13]
QKTFNPSFSKQGSLQLTIAADAVGTKKSFFGSRIIRDIDDLTQAIRSGAIDPTKIQINAIVRDGNVLILNTRTAEAFRRAGVPRSQWNVVDKTGDPLFEKLLSGQLRRNRLTSSGISSARPSRKP